MNERIILTEDTGKLCLPLEGNTLCVVHEKYANPCIPRSVSVPFKQFAADPAEYRGDYQNLVAVGLTKMIGPSNRTDLGKFNHIEGATRYSVDQVLFNSEPWRLWWHFGFVRRPYMDYPWSYLAESRYKAFIDGMGTNPFDVETATRFATGVVRSHYRKWFSVSVNTMPTCDATKADYQTLKERCFAEERTSAAVIKRLADFAQTSQPFRNIPTPSRLFAKKSHLIVKTDLAVDDWLTSRLMANVELTNRIAEACYVEL